MKGVICGVTIAPSAAFVIDNHNLVEYAAAMQNATNLRQKIAVIRLYGASCTAAAKR